MGDPIRIRSSSWPDMLDCALRWSKRTLEGIQTPTGAPSHIGSSIHASTAAFDLARLHGSPITPDAAAGVLVDMLHSPEYEVVWTDSDPTPKEAERIALRLHAKYCTEIAPTQRYRAVELLCDPLIVDCEGGIRIEMTGTADRVAEIDTVDDIGEPRIELGIRDLKSGFRRCTKAGDVTAVADGPQLGAYEILVENTMRLPVTAPAAIIGLQTSLTGGVGFKEVRNARQMLVGTDSYPGLMDIAVMYLKSGIFPPNPKSMLCSPRYCPVHATCPYHS